MKKPLHLLLPAFFFFAFAVSASAFSDVPGNHEYSAGISYVENEGIVSGYPDGTYRPDNSINRAEFLKIVLGSRGGYTAEEGRACVDEKRAMNWSFVYLTDVPLSEWFAPYVCVGYEKGVVAGYPDGTFRADESINFVETAKMVVSVSGFTLPDSDSAYWYGPYAEALSDRGAIPWTVESLNAFVTRGEMAEIMYRLGEGLADEKQKVFAGNSLRNPSDEGSGDENGDGGEDDIGDDTSNDDDAGGDTIPEKGVEYSLIISLSDIRYKVFVNGIPVADEDSLKKAGSKIITISDWMKEGENTVEIDVPEKYGKYYYLEFSISRSENGEKELVMDEKWTSADFSGKEKTYEFDTDDSFGPYPWDDADDITLDSEHEDEIIDAVKEIRDAYDSENLLKVRDLSKIVNTYLAHTFLMTESQYWTQVSAQLEDMFEEEGFGMEEITAGDLVITPYWGNKLFSVTNDDGSAPIKSTPVDIGGGWEGVIEKDVYMTSIDGEWVWVR